MRLALFTALLLCGIGEDGKPQPAPLVLYHEMLLTLVHSKEPEARIVYLPERVEFRTRRSALVGWADVSLKARFERHEGQVQLTAQTLHVQLLGLQTGKRFEQAKAGLLKLVNVRSAAQTVEIHEGDAVYRYLVIEPESR